MNKRAVVSSVLLLSLIMMPVSGFIAHAVPGTGAWLHLHALFGIIFLVAGICHVVYNWRALKNYLAGKK